jgi:hypothetical protein
LKGAGLQADLFSTRDEDGTSLLLDLLASTKRVLVKKLSNNDRDWARLPNKHQAGVYIPPRERDSGFFPRLETKDRAGGSEIRETFFSTVWPQVWETRRTRLVNYTGKGSETHMTGVPKRAFADLAPASFLVMAEAEDRDARSYTCLTVDSASDDALVLGDALSLHPEFHIDIRSPGDYRRVEQDQVLDFADEVIAAWLAGTIAAFAGARAAMPATLEMAEMARREFLKRTGAASLNPFLLAAPGDAVRTISRSIEWDLFREYQRRERAVSLVRLVMGDVPSRPAPIDIVRSLIDNLPAIDGLMLSASQQRKSRAGYSFEHHIETMLADGKLPFEKQVVMDAKKRPDFILPSRAWFERSSRESAAGLILSAKTTLRERWKQVQREMGDRDLFLATVDENVAANAIEDMAAMGITLVVPELLKISRDTEYVRHSNVISFKDFFESEIGCRRLPAWKTRPAIREPTAAPE